MDVFNSTRVSIKNAISTSTTEGVVKWGSPFTSFFSSSSPFSLQIILLTPKSQEKKKINKRKMHELLELVIRTILLFSFPHFGNQPFC
jgi:hypothetical protein